MASIYAVQKVSHIYFAYKYIIYTHVITCRNIQASREGLPLKRDRALLSDLQPKKNKKWWRHKCPVCASAVDMSASSHWLLPPSFVTHFRERRHWLPRVRRSQTIVWRHWAGGGYPRRRHVVCVDDPVTHLRWLGGWGWPPKLVQVRKKKTGHNLLTLWSRTVFNQHDNRFSYKQDMSN